MSVPYARKLLLFGLALAVLAAACTPAAATTQAPATRAATPEAESDPQPSPESDPEADTGGEVDGDLVIYSGRSEALVQPVIEQFEAANPGVDVVLKAGSNSELANALLEERANPQADLFLTTELLTVQRAAEEGVFQPYQSPEAQGLDPRYQHPEGLWTGLTLRARVIMYNTDLVAPEEVPQSIFDLTDPQYADQAAAAGSTNGSMQAQAAAMRQIVGDEATEAWLQGLVDNGVTFFGGHTDVRKAVGAGEFRVGLVNHYYYHLQKDEGSPVEVVYPDQGEDEMGVIVNATAVGLVEGARHPEVARAFIDYLLSAEGQETFAQLNYEYPVRPGVPLHPDVRPLDGLKLAEFDILAASRDLDSTLDMFEALNIP